MPTEAHMPRYYFHFSDGNRVFTDENGLELIDFADVKQRVISTSPRFEKLVF